MHPRTTDELREKARTRLVARARDHAGRIPGVSIGHTPEVRVSPPGLTFLHNRFGYVSAITQQTVGARAIVSLRRMREAFVGMNPETLAKVRRDTEREIAFKAAGAVGEAVRLWIQENDYDPDSVLAGQVTVAFREKVLSEHQPWPEEGIEVLVAVNTPVRPAAY